MRTRERQIATKHRGGRVRTLASLKGKTKFYFSERTAWAHAVCSKNKTNTPGRDEVFAETPFKHLMKPDYQYSNSF